MKSSAYTVVRATWLSRPPSSYAWLLTGFITLVMVLGSGLFWENYWQASEWMPASLKTVFIDGQWWRLWTTLFAHGDLGHLVSNTLLFTILGYVLSGYFGPFVFPLGAILFGGLTNLLVLTTYPEQVKLIGISGVVYWMGGFWLFLYLALDKVRSMKQRILRSLGVALSIFMPSTAFDPQVSYQAHLVGFVLGVFSGVLYYTLMKSEFAHALVYDTIIETDDEGEYQDDENQR